MIFARPLAALLLALALLAPASAAARLKVVASMTPLQALARAVGGDLVEVEALSASTQDPHFVDPRPSLVLLLHRADLLVVNGVELEGGWLPPLQRTARNSAIVAGGKGHFDASQHVTLRDVPAGRVDRSQGDVHPGGNPHFLSDPRAGARVAEALAERLATLDPPNAAAYRQRAAALATRLRAFADAQTRRFGTLAAERRKVVTYHASLGYLVAWLGLDVVATIEPKPGVAPSPAHVAHVRTALTEQGVRAILQEEYYPRSTAQTLARLAGTTLVTLSGGPRCEAGETYETWLTAIADGVYGALSR